MKKQKASILTIIMFCCPLFYSFAQDSTILGKINTQVWDNFERAFARNDVDLFISIHSKDVIRIPADKKVIIASADYFESQLESFKWIEENDYRIKVELRFIERICNEINASEKGIFKFTVIDDEGDIRTFYGKFHVLLRLEDNVWKIYMDYDSNEDGTINKETFNKAYVRTNFMPFQRKPE